MHGKMAVVYRVWDPSAQRLAAIKIYGAHPFSSATAAREAAALTRIGGGVAPALYDAGRTSTGRAYLVLELIEGRSLTELIKSGKTTLRVGLAAVAAAAEATAALLGRGVIHRDIAPGNIIVLSKGGPVDVRIIDFGCAHLLGKSDSGTEYLPLDPPGMTLGTAAYLAPERLKGEIGGPRSETFALSAIIFEMLTAAPPPRDAFEIIRALEKTHGFTADLQAMVVRGLAPDPAVRPAPSELAAALRAILAARAPASWSVGPKLVAGAAVFVFGAITCAVQAAVPAWIAGRDAHACASTDGEEAAAACARACRRDANADACAKGATVAGAAGDPATIEMLAAACRLRGNPFCVALWRSGNPLPAAAHACVAGDGESCLEAARLEIEAGRTEEAKKHLETGCARSEQNACARLGEVLADAKGASEAERRRAARLLEAACAADVGRACARLGRILESDPARAEALMLKACALHVASACVSVGKAHLGRGQAVAALPYLEQACDATGDHCGSLARLLIWSDDPKLRDPARGAAILDRACERKVGAACFLRGVLQIESGEQTEAAQSYGKGCAWGSNRSCEALRALVPKG